MPFDERRKRQLGRLTTPGRKPFEKLTVRQLPDRSQVEHGPELPPDSPLLSRRHAFTPVPRAWLRLVPSLP